MLTFKILKKEKYKNDNNKAKTIISKRARIQIKTKNM